MRLLLNCISSCFRIYWALIVLWSRVPIGVWRHCMITWLTLIPHRPFHSWSFETKPLSLTVSEIFNRERDAIVDVTLLRPVNKVNTDVPVTCTGTGRRHLRSAQTRQLVVPIERGQNTATEALPSKTTVYLLSCELQKSSEIFNGECDAMIEWPWYDL